MSHNVKVHGVKFKDLDTLEKALKELSKETNQQIHLIRAPTQIRGYLGRMSRNSFPVVIHMMDYSYDIGLTPNADGEYTMTTESMFRNNAFQGKRDKFGKLQQRYALIMAEQNLRRVPGAMFRRVQGKDGAMQLSVAYS